MAGEGTEGLAKPGKDGGTRLTMNILYLRVRGRLSKPTQPFNRSGRGDGGVGAKQRMSKVLT